MRVTLILMGKTSKRYIRDAMDEYVKRLGRYTKFNLLELPDVNATSAWSIEKAKKEQAVKLLAKVPDQAILVLLDERGKQMRSLQFAKQLENYLNISIKHLCIMVAGSYGAHEDLKQRADLILSLSNMTFSHQIIRPLILEQLYRAFSILKNEPYHNEG